MQSCSLLACIILSIYCLTFTGKKLPKYDNLSTMIICPLLYCPVHPCYIVLTCQLMHFPHTRFWPCRFVHSGKFHQPCLFVHSYKFNPCNMMPNCQLPHCPLPQIQRSHCVDYHSYTHIYVHCESQTQNFIHHAIFFVKSCDKCVQILIVLSLLYSEKIETLGNWKSTFLRLISLLLL